MPALPWALAIAAIAAIITFLLGAAGDGVLDDEVETWSDADDELTWLRIDRIPRGW